MRKSEKPYDIGNLREILRNNRKEALHNIHIAFAEHIIEKKHGRRRGLLCATPCREITGKDISEAINEAKHMIAPLAKTIQIEATMSFARVLGDMSDDPGCKAYLHYKAASALGKKGGGGRKGVRKPHTVWLDKAMKEIKQRCDDGLEPFTVTSYFTELLNHPDIDEEDDDGKLVFRNSVLEDMGHTEGRKEPSISKNMVEKALTRLNKVP